jgi:hypothetical protein
VQVSRSLIRPSVLILALSIHADAAVVYRFSSVAEQSYAKESSGRVVVDGKRWRIDFDAVPNAVTYMTAVIGNPDGTAIALNDENHTWYRLASRERLASDRTLFTYSRVVGVSRLKASSSTRAADVVIAFSYRLDIDAGGERVPADVWGEIRVRTMDRPSPVNLPWKPDHVETGLEAVDALLKDALLKIEGTVSECEIEVSRRFEGGAVLKQTTHRKVTGFKTAEVSPHQFEVPSGYRYQEPLIGGPGLH